MSLDLVRELQAAGGEIIQKDGRWVIRGDPPEDLMVRIRDNRDAVIEAWEDDLRSRYDRAPFGEVRMRAKAPVWRDDVRARVTRFVESQNGEVTAWMAQRMAEYLGAGMSGRDAQAAAMMDLLQFQLARQYARGEDLVQYLTLLE